MHRQSGNTLSEYSILIGFISILALTGLKVMGLSISDLLGTASNASTQNKIDDYYSTVMGVSIKPAAGQGGNATGANTAGKNMNLLTTDLHSDTNTTGIEGTDVEVVQNHLQAFSALVQALKDDPNHDPGILEIATELANSGHVMGSNMKTAFLSYSNSGLESQEFVKSYADFYMQRAEFSNNRATLDKYVATHPQALPPELKQKVDAAGEEIRTITDSLIGMDSANEAKWTEMREDAKAHSVTVHQDANTICKNGGDQKLCVQ